MKRTQAYILIILSGFLFATSGIFVRFLTPYGFSSLQRTAMRGVVSAIILSVYVLIKNRKLFKTELGELFLFFLSGLTMFMCAYFYYASLEHTTIATAVVLMYTSPIYVLLFSVMFLKEKITTLKILAVATMIIGAALVSGITGGIQFDFLGVIFGLLSGISYSAYNIITKYAMKRKNNPITTMVYCYIFVAAISGLSADMFGMVTLTLQNPYIILPMILGIGIFTCALPYLIYTFALKEIPAGTASALGLVDPMAAILYGVILFKEPLSVSLVLGIILILGSIFAISTIKE